VHYERLTATDATFLRIETPHEPQHVGSLSVIEGAPLRDETGRVRFDELRRHVARRLHRVPRLRHKIMEVPYDQGRPVWVDDANFDIDYHVRLTSLPRPGDDEQLSVLMARLQSLPLDRARPLWEMWFIDGLAGDEVGLIIKTHHSLGDGIANVDLALALIDLERNPDPDGEPPGWQPRPAPSPRRLLTDSVTDQLGRPMRFAQSTGRMARDPRPAITTTVNALKTAINFLSQPQPTVWNRAVSPHRRWVHADVPLDLARAVKQQHSVTLNDVVLAACSGALRDFMVEHGDGVDGRTLKAMVPVSLRGDHEHGAMLGNLVSMIVVDLPVHESDPTTRLRTINSITTELKGSGLVDGAQTIIEVADAITPFAIPLTRFVSRRIPMNLVITNIPGPPIPLYLLGAKILRTYPYVEVVDREGLTIAVVSYEGQLLFGITSDRDVVPDLDRIAAGIEEHFELLSVAH
jgi:diacylglycerol O-acyltransferase